MPRAPPAVAVLFVCDEDIKSVVRLGIQKTDARLQIIVTHWNNSLQTHVEISLLVHLQFLQCHPGLSNELVVPKLVLITDRQPAQNQCQDTIQY